MSRLLQTKSPDEKAARRQRVMRWSFFIMLAGIVALPLSGYLYVYLVLPPVQAATKQETNPRANFWRYVREGNAGYTSESGPYTTNVLIQNSGENWRQLRNGPVANFAPWWLAIVLLAIGAFHILHGPFKLKQGASGKTVLRWSLSERVLHWYTATLFILLAITGLSLLFGRAALIPVFGLKGFSIYADIAKGLHNYLGPFLVVGVLLEIVAWIKDNLPQKTDWQWIKSWGGTAGQGAHAHAGRFNGGEKMWFWYITTGGVAACITGLIMDFPNFGQTREIMQYSNLIHSVLAIIWVSIVFAHIYIGTAGTEGALEGMTTGRVSVEWAKQHHDLWYEEVRAKGENTGEYAPKIGKGAPSPRGSSS